MANQVMDFISQEVTSQYHQLMKDQKVKNALEFIKNDHDKTVQDQMELTRIPAPTFDEKSRGENYKKRLEELGLEEICVDKAGNVMGKRKGTGSGPSIVVSAHLDTVFPEGTDTEPKLVDGKIYAPGIADDGRGLTAVLAVLRALNQAGVETEGDIILGATVGEEGLGDLYGVKELFQDGHGIDGFISIEPGSPERTTYLATGSLRYRVTFTGTGGHSFGDFGIPSAIHALGRAVAAISEIVTPKDPKTTFTVGQISGGTSVNTIAESAAMLIDLRSTSRESLLDLNAKVMEVLDAAVEAENRRWESESIQVTIEKVGDRPAGTQSERSQIVQAALAATHSLGFVPELDGPSSTDSNVPISMGIPAVTLGGGGDFGGVHTLNEFFDPREGHYGIQKVLLTVLGLAGVKDVTTPLLKGRTIGDK